MIAPWSAARCPPVARCNPGWLGAIGGFAHQPCSRGRKRHVAQSHDHQRKQRSLLGFTGRPVDALRITGDFQFGYNDNSFTRIDPRQVQSYKIHATYTPQAVGESGWRGRDPRKSRQRLRPWTISSTTARYSFATILTPNPRLSIDFGYNYWDVYTQSVICFNYSITSANPAPPPATVTASALPSGVRCCHRANLPDCRCVVAPRSAFDLQQHGSFRPRDLIWKPHEAGDGRWWVMAAASSAATRFS